MSVTVSEQLPLLAVAPNGIKKLRELILELAVRGKLVAQDASDDPASELLKRIAIERKRKGFDKSSTDTKEASQFDLPAGWEWVRFGEIAQHNAGKTLDRGRNQGVVRDYITTSNLYWGHFALENVRQMAIRDEEVERCTARKDDLLICEGGEAGRAAVWEEDREICFQNHIHRARFYGCISPHFAYRVLERLNVTGEINGFRKGVAISSMSGKALASIPFPLPPLAEQHRIVAKVDELMALCDRLEAQQADAESAHAQLVATVLESLTRASDSDDFAVSWQRLSAHFHTLFTTESSIDALKQALLQLAVMGKLVPQDPSDEPASILRGQIAREKEKMTDRARRWQSTNGSGSDEFEKFALPVGWEWVSISELVLQITDGTHHTPTYLPAGVPFISVKDVDGRTINFDHCKYISMAEHESINARSNPELGDILLCRIGTLGRPTIVDTQRPFSLFVSVGLLKLPKSVSISNFLHMLLSSPLLYRQYDQIKAGGSHTNKLNLGDIPRLMIPLPPLAEQGRIISKVHQLMAHCDHLISCLSQASELKEQLATALVQRAVA